MDSGTLVIEKKEYILIKRLIYLSNFYKDKSLQKTLGKLSCELETAHIYSENEMPKNVVRINSIVTLTSKENYQKGFQLVLSSEDISDQGKVSIFTPLEAALIGQTEGNQITLDYESNEQTFEITKIYQYNKNISLYMVL